MKDNLPLSVCIAKDTKNEEAKFTANLVNALSDEIRKVLNAHPINIERKASNLAYTNLLLLRGCG